MIDKEALIKRALKKTIFCKPWDARITRETCRARWEVSQNGDAKLEAKRDIFRAFIKVDMINGVVPCLECPRAKRYFK